MSDDAVKKAELVRDALQSQLRQEFLRFVAECKDSLALQDAQASLNGTLKETALTLARKLKKRKGGEGTGA